MSEFQNFKKKFQESFKKMIEGQGTLYVVNVDKEVLWDTYLNSFPAEEKQGHNCNCCKQFIRNYAGVVAIKENKIVSMWDFKAEEPFDTVVKNLKKVVEKAPVRDVFVNTFAKLGTDKNAALLTDGTTTTWYHLYYELPRELVYKGSKSEEAIMGEARSTKDVFKRGLEEITVEALETVIELTDQGTLVRGAEFKTSVTTFLDLKKKYDKLKPAEKDNFAWVGIKAYHESVTKIRNISIGTLLIDLSEGKLDLDESLRKWEKVMAPTNYKRPNAVFSKKDVENAEKKLQELGLEESLGRRFATPEEIRVNSLLFVDRDARKPVMGSLLGDLKDSVPTNPKSLGKVEEVAIADFVEKILPKVSSVEVLFENKHIPNLVSLIAPVHPDAPSLFKWDNAYSWSYNKAIADSMKERVKAAGGNVEGVLRFSIQWNEDGKSICDLDAHAYEPNGVHIFFSSGYRKDSGDRRTAMSGQLDVDMIRPSGVGVENITWTDRSKMQYGVYKFAIHNYDDGNNGGFSAEIEFDGEIHTFAYVGKRLRGTVYLADVTYSKDGFSINPLIPSNSVTQSKKVWNLDTNKFHKVNSIMKSPNYWGDNKVGNEHIFFMLEGAENDEEVRGFFNEFLRQDLLEHKRVFEALGGKMKVEPSHKQLSGIGFSTSTRGEMICKVSGAFTRTLKIRF